MYKQKKRRQKGSHLPLLSMLLMINLCGILILTAFNYYIFQYKNKKNYQESFISYNQQITELAFKNIDQKIMQSVLELPQQYFSSIDENKPLLLPQAQPIADSPEHIRALSAEMLKLQKSYPFLAALDVYYEATDTVVTNFSHVHFPQSSQSKERYLPWYAGYQELTPPQKRVWTMGSMYLMDKPQILHINRITFPGRTEKGIILCAAIDPQSFSSYIPLNTGELLITTDDGKILYSSEQWKELPVTFQMETSQFQTINEQVVFHNTSSVSGLNYYYAVDSSLFFQDNFSISHMFLFNFLLSLLFNVTLLFVISHTNHSIYRRQMHTLSKKAGIDLDDSKHNFDSSLNLLEQEIISLHQAVDSSKGLVLQNEIRSMLLSETSLPTQEPLSPYLTRPFCRVVLIDFPQADVETPPVNALQEDYPPGRGDYDVLFATINAQKLAAVLIFSDKSWENVRKDFIEDMNGRWKSWRMTMGILVPTNQEGIQKSYLCAAEAARYQYIFTESSILSYDQLHISQRKNEGSHLKIFDAIHKDINNSNLKDLKFHIDMLITSFKTGNYTIDYCQSTLRDLVALLYQVMQQNQLDTWAIFGYGIRTHYQKIENIDAFQAWCNMACETILKNLVRKRQSVNEKLYLQILNFVDEHLEHDISLDLLADHLKIRPDNASRLFRQIMGTGYTEYIKTRKLKRAEELMAQGCSVKDTAEMLGYSSAQYFIKVFKENYGVTPFQYKKSHEGNEGS